MPRDIEKSDFKLDPESQSFRMTGSVDPGVRWGDLPGMLLVLALLIGLFVGMNVLFFASSRVLSEQLQWVAWGLVAGLLVGYRMGARSGRRREREESAPLPPVSEQVVQLAGEQGLIAAIKLYREETGADLRQAKRAVEACLEDDAAG